MSYADHEISDYSGQPLELYRFALGDQVWLFTSADHEVAVSESEIYTPVFIKRSGFTKSGDARKETMEIEVAPQNDVAMLLRSGWMTGTLIITIFRRHYGDFESSILWKGRIIGCSWADTVATLKSDSAFTLFKRSGLRRVYQVGCPHVLFSAACGLAEADWKVTATVVSVVDNLWTVDGIGAFGTGYFVGGMAKHGDSLRMITAHSATNGTIRIADAIPGIEAGDTITLWPGCHHTMNHCINKFNNVANYGGLPFLPSKNPFSGDALV